MRGILGFIGISVIAVSSSTAQAQTGKVTVKGGIVAKQPSECDALCQLSKRSRKSPLVSTLRRTKP